jgi:hypothetical protein
MWSFTQCGLSAGDLLAGTGLPSTGQMVQDTCGSSQVR